jgi:hypothetical protein
MTVPSMEPMTWAELVKNNPEWAAVIVSGIFAAITIIVLAWQVVVMIWCPPPLVRIGVSGT